MTEFQAALLDWFDRNQRDLPWRRAAHADPYAVWVSEAMLQQTTVAAVVPYFERWMARFPTAVSLAEAPPEEVLVFWQGLGYYSRARNLQAGIQRAVAEGWPASVDEWLAMPGVGQYTAGAIASIAQNIPAPLVDGNVERVYARLQMDGSVGPKLKGSAWIWAKDHLVSERPGDWNQALMELGATICTPKNPQCAICPVSPWCAAFQHGKVADYPAPKPKKEWVALAHSVVVTVCDGQVGLIQSQPGEWWAGLWHPPRLDSTEPIPNGSEVVGQFSHVVTRHKITATVYRLQTDLPQDGFTYVPLADIARWPISAPGRRAIQMALAANPDLTLPGLE